MLPATVARLSAGREVTELLSLLREIFLLGAEEEEEDEAEGAPDSSW